MCADKHTSLETSTIDVATTSDDDVTHLETNDDRRSLLQKDPEHAIVYLALVLTVVPIGTFGNIAIIGAHCCYRKLRKKGKEVVINLALADLCITAFIGPMCVIAEKLKFVISYMEDAAIATLYVVAYSGVVTANIYLGVFKGEIFFDDKKLLCDVIASTCLTACFASFLSLGLITISQYLCVCHNQYYYKVMGRKRVIAACVMIWCSAFIMQLPNIIGIGDQHFNKVNHQCIWDHTASHGYTYFVGLGCILCPLILMMIAYARLFYAIRCSKRRVLKFASDSMTAKELFIKEWQETVRTCRTLIILVIAFLVCWLPYVFVLLTDITNHYPVWVHLWITYLAHLRSVLNFWIYLATSQDYRTGFAIFLGLRSQIPSEKRTTFLSMFDQSMQSTHVPNLSNTNISNASVGKTSVNDISGNNLERVCKDIVTVT